MQQCSAQRAPCSNGNHSGNHTGRARGRWPQRSCASTHKQARTNKHAQTNTQRARQAQRAPRVRQLAVLHGRRHSRCGMLPPRAASRRRRGAVAVHRADGCGGPCARRLSGESPARSLHDGAHRSPHVARCAVACCIAMSMVRGVTMSASCAQHGARCAMSAVWCRLHEAACSELPAPNFISCVQWRGMRLSRCVGASEGLVHGVPLQRGVLLQTVVRCRIMLQRVVLTEGERRVTRGAPAACTRRAAACARRAPLQQCAPARSRYRPQ